MNLNFKQLEAFVWVADLGSFRRAADRLNTTQPNISARISALEQMLNVKLMDRDAGSVRLTAKGAVLLEEARKVLRSAESFLESADRSSLVEGVLRLGVTEMIVNTWLRDFLKQAKEAFPNLSIELMVDLSANLTPELFSRSIDVTFQSGPFLRQTSGSQELGVYPFAWVASPELGLEANKKLSLDDMQNDPILTHARGTRPFEEIAAHFNNGSPNSSTIIPSSSIAPCLHMALDGIGIACLPAAMVHSHVASGRLVALNYPWLPSALEFRACYDAKAAPAVVKKIVQLAQDIAAQYPKNIELQGS